MKKLVFKAITIVGVCLLVSLIPSFFQTLMDLYSAEMKMGILKIKFFSRLGLFILILIGAWVFYTNKRKR